MTATREKKVDFIVSMGREAVESAVLTMLRRKEYPWFTDDQIDDLTTHLVEDLRLQSRFARQNREAAKRQRVIAYIDAGRQEPPVFRDRPGLKEIVGGAA
jgi:hypothetical protein